LTVLQHGCCRLLTTVMVCPTLLRVNKLYFFTFHRRSLVHLQ